MKILDCTSPYSHDIRPCASLSKSNFTSCSSIERGHVGIEAFRLILTDPRVQNIPLILETPSFEKPDQVWKREIEVLNQLSLGNCGDMPAVVGELRAVVEAAGGVQARVKVGKAKPKGRSKTKRKADDEDAESDEEDETSEDEH